MSLSCDEDWRPVSGFEDTYVVSSQGRVIRIGHAGGARVGRCLTWILKPCQYGGGAYAVVVLSRGNRARQRYVHHLVAEAFLGPRPDGHEINHRDADKLNNTASNLEYVRPIENVRHAIQAGLWRHEGSHNGSARLSEEQIRFIRWCATWIPRRVLAARFGIRRHTLNGILAGRAWRHVPPASAGWIPFDWRDRQRLPDVRTL